MSSSSVKNIKKLFIKNTQNFSTSPIILSSVRTNSTTLLTNSSSVFSKTNHHKHKTLTCTNLSTFTSSFKKSHSNKPFPHKRKSTSPHKTSSNDKYQRMIYKQGLLNLNINVVLKSVHSDIKQRKKELKLSRNRIFNKKMQIKPNLPYPFIVNTNSNFSYITSSSIHNTIKQNNKSKLFLHKKTKDVFEQPFSLIKPKSKYHTVIHYDKSKQEEISKYERNEEEIHLIGKKLKKIFLKNNNFSPQRKLSFKENSTTTKQNLFNKIKRNIIRAATHFHRMKISLKVFYSNYKPIKTPFTYESTHLLILGIKNQNEQQCKDLLSDNRGLVLDYDYFMQTPLHWAAKRNYFSFIPELIKYGASVDFKDCIGRSAIHIAVKLNHCESALFLFMETASPFVVDDDGKRPVDYCQSSFMKSLCDRATLLHVVHSMGRQKDFYHNVKRGFVYFVRHELPYEIFKRVYLIALEKEEDDDEK